MYDATVERLHYLVHEFDNIFVSFFGGKDSGLLLNLLLDFRRKYYPNRRIGVFHQDIDKPLNHRMASTIRHNRARGSHKVDLMKRKRRINFDVRET